MQTPGRVRLRRFGIRMTTRLAQTLAVGTVATASCGHAARLGDCGVLRDALLLEGGERLVLLGGASGQRSGVPECVPRGV